MKVSDLMVTDVAACSVSTTLNRAARIMLEHDCGCVPVVDDMMQVVGMVTDRDACMGAFTNGRPLHKLNVGGSMSAPAVTCRADTPIETAETLMREKEIRRLPVVDDQGALLGVLSLSDVIQAVPLENAALDNWTSDLLQTLATVTKPRTKTNETPQQPEMTTEPPPAPKRAATTKRKSAKPRSARHTA